MPYPSESDVLAAHFSACIEEAPDHRLANADLHASVARWVAEHRLPPISPKRIAMWLHAAGYRQGSRNEGGRSWIGLRLRRAG